MVSRRVLVLSIAIAIVLCGCKAAELDSSSPANPVAEARAGTGGQSTPSVQWIRFTDTAEGAFSMDVPAGWQVLGGMYRFGYLDVRWMVDVRSLDGKVLIRINDPNVPPYVLPGPHSGPAGHAAIRPQMYQMIVDNYREAEPYAANYARQRFGSTCRTWTERQTDWTMQLPALATSAPTLRSSQATVEFDCATDDGPRVAVVYARSVVHGEGLWQVDPIVSILATPDRLPAAEEMAQHMLSSMQESPDWEKFQQHMTTLALGQMTAEFGQFLKQMQAYHQQREAAMNAQVSQYEARQHAQAAQASSWGETLTGLTTVRDSQTGTEFQVFSGPKANYYRNGMGVTVNSNISPGAGFYQVPEVHP